MTGVVTLVGAGPGDPELLTIKAVRMLERADVVLHDRLVSEAVLAFIPPHVERVPVGKERGSASRTQERIMHLMLSHALRGRRVVRLKGGDPFVYGRGGEEWAYLASHGVRVEVVPGISSALAVPSLAGIPLTHRGVSGSFAVVTGHRSDGPATAWEAYAGVETLVVLMGVANRVGIARRLIDAGRPDSEPAAFVTAGTTPEEKVVVSTLGEIAAGGVAIDPPAVLVIGEVVRLRDMLGVRDVAVSEFESTARPVHVLLGV